MKNYYDFEMIGVPGLSMPIEKPTEYNNDFSFNIILENKVVGTFRIVEMMGTFNFYYIDIFYDTEDKEKAADFLEELKFQCRLKNIPGTDEENYVLSFGSEYETVKFYKLLDIKPGEIIYKR